MPKRTERISFTCARCGSRGTKRLIGPGSSRIWCARCENAVGNVDDKLDAIIVDKRQAPTEATINMQRAVHEKTSAELDRTLHYFLDSAGMPNQS